MNNFEHPYREREIEETLFDYGNITDNDKLVVKEVISILKNSRKNSIDSIVQEIEHKFQITNTPTLDLTKSVWYNLIKDEPVSTNLQGYRMDKDENGDPIKIPHIAFSADLDKLDMILNKLVTNIKKI
jgi:hypothetical protein